MTLSPSTTFNANLDRSGSLSSLSCTEARTATVAVSVADIVGATDGGAVADPLVCVHPAARTPTTSSLTTPTKNLPMVGIVSVGLDSSGKDR